MNDAVRAKVSRIPLLLGVVNAVLAVTLLARGADPGRAIIVFAIPGAILAMLSLFLSDGEFQTSRVHTAESLVSSAKKPMTYWSTMVFLLVAYLAVTVLLAVSAKR